MKTRHFFNNNITSEWEDRDGSLVVRPSQENAVWVDEVGLVEPFARAGCREGAWARG